MAPVFVCSEGWGEDHEIRGITGLNQFRTAVLALRGLDSPSVKWAVAAPTSRGQLGHRDQEILSMVLGTWFLIDARAECWGGGEWPLGTSSLWAIAKLEKGSQALLSPLPPSGST